MFSKTIHLFTILLLFILTSCENKPENRNEPVIVNTPVIDLVKTDTIQNKENETVKKEIGEKEEFRLTEENAIPFFFEYQKENKEDKVKVTTNFGSFVIDLFEETPYHRANFIYLTKKKYFNDTYFHRVVKNFIIQGGNSDNVDTGKKRGEIGSYLLPPDAKKGFKHHRGIVSMPSSEIDNPHKLASPYEFFIVVQKPGAYHLDGNYTAFGRVIEGMSVVDEINQLKTDNREWPFKNAVILDVEIVE